MRRSSVLAVAALAAAIAAFLVLRKCGSSSGSADGDGAGGGSARDGARQGGGAQGDDGSRRRMPPTSPFAKEFDPSVSAQGSRVKGVVVDVDSRERVPYVDVTFKQAGGESSANSGADGEFEIELMPGTYEVRAIGEDVIAASRAPVAVGHAEGVPVEIEVTQLAKVRGKVFYANGAAAAGATVGPTRHMVHLRNYVQTGELAAAETYADGSFELRLPPGTVELRATDGATDGFAQVADLESGAERDGVQIVLDSSCGVEGIVLLADGTPAADADMLLSLMVPRTAQADWIYDKADSGGRFRRDGLRPGTIVLEAVVPGYAPSEPLILELSPGETKRGLELRLFEPASITGTVVDAEGAPIEGAEVIQGRIGSKARYQRTLTSDDGSFLITGVGPGPHMIRAVRSGYVRVERRDVMAPVEDLVLQMQLAGGIHGTITAAGGAAVRRFAIEVRRPKGGRLAVKRFFTENGRYDVFPIDPGTYDVIIRAPDHEEQLVEGVKVESGKYTTVDGSMKRN